ncbi:MAG: hypothetical protein H0T42_29410, partial [Deltaproteobacteria bacterium]|nr:hypothetical protein [Deltaproteobacteria bacterium]
YELVAGHPPHQGETAVAILTSVVLSRPRLPHDVPSELAQISGRAMQPDPADRYESIEALQHALQGYLEHRGSSRLAASATELLGKLLGITAERDRARSEEIYRLLATCRFGFHQALAVWPTNRDARAGIARATIAVAEYELVCGDPRAAVTLLSELDERPALRATALAAADADAARRAANELQLKDADPTVHKRTRTIIVALAVVFTAIPFVGAVRGTTLNTHVHQIAWGASCFVGLSVLAFYVRNWTTTAVNRRVFSAAWFLFCAQTILAVGASLMEISIEHTQILNMLLWGAIAGMFALMIDRWMAVCSISYFIAFLLATQFPEHRLYFTGTSNLVLTAVMGWRWRPAEQRLQNERKA